MEMKVETARGLREDGVVVVVAQGERCRDGFRREYGAE